MVYQLLHVELLFCSVIISVGNNTCLAILLPLISCVQPITEVTTARYLGFSAKWLFGTKGMFGVLDVVSCSKNLLPPCYVNSTNRINNQC